MARKHPKVEGGYILIPKDTLRCKQYQDLSNATKLVYIAFYMEFIRDTKKNPFNKVQVTHNQLEVYSGVSHGAVVTGVKLLKANNFVRVLIQGGLELNQSTYQMNGRYTDTGVAEARW